MNAKQCQAAIASALAKSARRIFLAAPLQTLWIGKALPPRTLESVAVSFRYLSCLWIGSEHLCYPPAGHALSLPKRFLYSDGLFWRGTWAERIPRPYIMLALLFERNITQKWLLPPVSLSILYTRSVSVYTAWLAVKSNRLLSRR